MLNWYPPSITIPQVILSRQCSSLIIIPSQVEESDFRKKKIQVGVPFLIVPSTLLSPYVPIPPPSYTILLILPSLILPPNIITPNNPLIPPVILIYDFRKKKISPHMHHIQCQGDFRKNLNLPSLPIPDKQERGSDYRSYPYQSIALRYPSPRL